MGWLPKQAEAVAAYRGEIGVKAKIIPIDFATHRARYQKIPTDPKLQGNAASHRSPSRWLPPSGLRIYYHSQDVIHLLSIPELDKMIDASLAEPNQKKRTELNTKAATIGHNQFVAIPTAYGNALFGMSNKIAGWQTIAGWSYISLAYETVQKNG